MNELLRRELDQTFLKSRKAIIESIIQELSAFKQILEVCRAIKNFQIEHENDNENEGLVVSKINTFNQKVKHVHIGFLCMKNHDQSDNYWNTPLFKNMTFELKLKESDLKRDLILLGYALDHISDATLNQIVCKSIDIEFLKNHINELKTAIKN